MQKRDLAKHNILSWLKTFNKLGLEGIYPNKIKAMCNKFSHNNILKNEQNKSFFSKVRNKTRIPILTSQQFSPLASLLWYIDKAIQATHIT